MTSDEPKRGALRFWIAAIVTILLVVAVWKIIDYRMRPPPPPAAEKIDR